MKRKNVGNNEYYIFDDFFLIPKLHLFILLHHEYNEII